MPFGKEEIFPLVHWNKQSVKQMALFTSGMYSLFTHLLIHPYVHSVN